MAKIQPRRNKACHRWLALTLAVAAGVDAAQAGGNESAEPAPSSFQRALADIDTESTRRGGDPADRFAIEILDSRMRRENERLSGRTLTPVSPLLANDKEFGAGMRRLANTLKLSEDRFQTVAPFIVGGSPIPSAIDLVALSGETGFDGPFCSGTLIAARRVLTAAHCVCNGAAKFVHAGERIRHGAVASAEVERVHFIDAGFECPTAPRAGMSLGDTTQVETRGRDIAVLEISSRLDGALRRPLLSKAKFDSWRTGPHGYFVRAAGYGFTATPTRRGGGAFGHRLYADIAVARAPCGPRDGSFGCVPGAELVAAGHPAHRKHGARPDTCDGDSGGPIYAMLQEGGKKNFYLVGVTSRGIDQDCGSGGIYALTARSDAAAWLEVQGAAFH